MMGTPGIVFLFIFAYLPMFGIILAFKKYNFADGILGSPWVGLDNFRFFFSYPDAWRITRNTIGLNLLFMVSVTAVGIAFALMLNEVRRKFFVKLYQTVFFFPYFLSWIVVGFVVYAFLNMQYGIANTVLEWFGLGGIQWYAEAKYWPAILTIVTIWKTAGYTCIIYYAGLMGINEDYYEAARIDGATKLQMVRYISLPLLTPLIMILLILQIGGIMSADFGLFFHVTRDIGLLYSTTDVIDTYVYRTLRSIDIGMASAVGLYQSFVGFLLVMITNYIVNKINPENALY
jgi:putative aldouronate transport system permease protein